MNKAAQVNAVAVHLQGVMHMLDDFFSTLVGKDQHNIILLVCAGDEEQYIANVSRERGIASLRHLLARWQVGLPDTLPESVTADTAAFELLLNEYEQAVRENRTDEQTPRGTIGNHRTALLRYVDQLLGQVKRGQHG